MKKYYLTQSVLMVLLGLMMSPVVGQGLKFRATLSGAQVVPVPTNTDATATIEVKCDEGFTEAQVKIDSTAIELVLGCGLVGEPGVMVLTRLMDGEVTELTLTNPDLVGGAICDASIGRMVTKVVSLAFAMREGLIFAEGGGGAEPTIRGQLLEDTGKVKIRVKARAKVKERARVRAADRRMAHPSMPRISPGS